jgi:hypothetical protein
MGKETVDKPKEKCCGKYRKNDKHCKRCPLIVREQCQRKTEKEKKMGKDKKKSCSKKECKKKEKADKKKEKKKSKKKGKKK